MFDPISLERQFTDSRKARGARRLVFSGARNFRDLGGYAAADGRTVRWGMLYRSDNLHKLTDADLNRLSALSLALIVDFRAVAETTREPDRLPVNAPIRHVKIPINDASTSIWYEMHDDFVKHLDSVNPGEYLTKTNIELVTRFTPEIRQFMQEVLAAHGNPLLFHCAAGKDRTGFASALLLRLLGVPQATVIEDYLLTNHFLADSLRWSMFLLRFKKGKRFADVVSGFMRVQPAYLQAAFDTIDREYGSFDAYLHSTLGLTEKDIEHLRNVYLE